MNITHCNAGGVVRCGAHPGGAAGRWRRRQGIPDQVSDIWWCCIRAPCIALVVWVVRAAPLVAIDTQSSVPRAACELLGDCQSGLDPWSGVSSASPYHADRALAAGGWAGRRSGTAGSRGPTWTAPWWNTPWPRGWPWLTWSDGTHAEPAEAAEACCTCSARAAEQAQQQIPASPAVQRLTCRSRLI